MARLSAVFKEAAMQDARYLREQAFKCLQLARQVQMGNLETAENLRSLAARYCERALAIEAAQSEADANAGHFVKPLALKTKP
jgi:hypothetical protein